MKALTLHRPWTDAILYGGKRVENRSWHPPHSLIGQTIALHAGKVYDEQVADWMDIQGLYTPPARGDSPMGIVGVASLLGSYRAGVLNQLSKDPWFFGPVGWLLGDVVAFRSPIPCRGAQGLWTVPEDLEQRIREAIFDGECKP